MDKEVSLPSCQIRHCVTGIPSVHSLSPAFLKDRIHRALSQRHCGGETSQGTGPRSCQREGSILIYPQFNIFNNINMQLYI